MAKKRYQADHRADLRGEPFIGLPAAVVYSEAYTGLSLAARAVLIEILGRFKGYNNGLIGVSSRELCARLNTSNARRISIAVRELFEAGLIDIPVEGKWKARQARLYRLPFISSGKGPPFQPATNEYAKNPPRAFSGADNASAGKPRFAERASAGTLGLADNASATGNGKPPFNPSATADNASTLICKPYQGASLNGCSHRQIGAKITDGPARRNCASCGEPFVPTKPTKLYCERACKERAKQRRHYRRVKAAEAAHG